MTLFTNKENFADRPEIMELLEKLEKAHADQDELASAVLLTKLRQLNITIKPEDKEVH